MSTAFDYDAACDRLSSVLRGPLRREIVDALSDGSGSDVPLSRLRRAMRSHTFPTASARLNLRSIVDSLDARCRREGLHILHPWDFTSHRRPDETASVLLVDYCARLDVPASRAGLALLLDHYLLGVLSLLAVRAWDHGDANENLDVVTRLISELQGPDGSGHRFVDDAETLLLLAVSYYHPEEASYDALLGKVRTLDPAHQLRAAIPAAGMLGSHLRWGFRFMYRRDVGRMRDDNIVDYPWLLFSLLLPMREYARLCAAGVHPDERQHVVEALLNGLSADPWAFRGKAPAALTTHQAEYAEFCEFLAKHRDELLQDFALHRPTAAEFSPLAWICNFPLNAVVAAVVVAYVEGSASRALNALFRASPSADPSPESYARGLMRFASDPTRLDARQAPLIVYDPYDGIRTYAALQRALGVPAGDAT